MLVNENIKVLTIGADRSVVLANGLGPNVEVERETAMADALVRRLGSNLFENLFGSFGCISVAATTFFRLGLGAIKTST